MSDTPKAWFTTGISELLVIGLEGHVTAEHAALMHEAIRKQYPDLDVLIVSGVAALAVVMREPGTTIEQP